MVHVGVDLDKRSSQIAGVPVSRCSAAWALAGTGTVFAGCQVPQPYLSYALLASGS
jgi:hypothetical protein